MGEELYGEFATIEWDAIIEIRAARCARHIVNNTIDTQEGLINADSLFIVCHYLAKSTRCEVPDILISGRDLAQNAVTKALQSLARKQLDLVHTVDEIYWKASPDLI